MGLKLSLKPGEKVAINGAVIVNGDRRASLVVENRASILRERDIMRAEEATTPARRVYLAVMLIALDPASKARSFSEFDRRIKEFADAVSDPGALALCLKIAADVADNRAYRALAHCRSLIGLETEILAHVA
jgi:flagellar protein FlbT